MTGPKGRMVRRAGACALALASLLGCRERAERLMRVDAAAPPAPSSPAEDESEVHFTFTGPTSVAFSWHGTGRTMRIWSKSTPPREIEAHEPSPTPFSGPGPWKEATITGVEPGVEYGYEIGRPRYPVPAFFRVPPAPGTAGFSFVAVAGLGSSIDFPEVEPLHRLIATQEPAFVLGLGDLTFADIRAQSAVDRHFDDVMTWSRAGGVHARLGRARVGHAEPRRSPQLQGSLRAPAPADVTGRAGPRLLRQGLVLVRLRQRALHLVSRAVHGRDVGRLGGEGGAALRPGRARSGHHVHDHDGPPPGLLVGARGR